MDHSGWEQWRAHRAKTQRRYSSKYLEFVLAHAAPNPRDLDDIEAELPNVLAGMNQASTDRCYLDVVEYASVLCRPESGCLGLRGYWQELYQHLQIAVQAARWVAPDEEAAMRHNLAVVLMKQGNLGQADSQVRQALTQFELIQEKCAF